MWKMKVVTLNTAKAKAFYFLLLLFEGSIGVWVGTLEMFANGHQLASDRAPIVHTITFRRFGANEINGAN